VKAEEFTKVIRRLKRKVGSFEKAFAAYAKQQDSKADTVERKYWTAVEVCKRGRAERWEHTKGAAMLIGETPFRFLKRAIRASGGWSSRKK
jgi:hypothetical protein